MNTVLVDGDASGEALFLAAPLSFWGGVDPATGEIIDVGHPQRGRSVKGRVLVMAHGRGSSSSSAVLAESLRLGTGPAAIVLEEPDQIIVTGSLVAAWLYGVECPVVVGVLTGEGSYRVSSAGVERLA